MYIGSWKIDDLVTFTCSTHDVATGAATDADAVPAYRVYEDETGTAILTGNMAKLDDANTTGFYSEQITLSAANGFEKGKSYNILITATVDSVAGATERFLQVEAEVDANVVSGTVATVTNVTTVNGLAANTITAASIATGAIDADAIADNAIDAGSIAADAITAAKIADGAIDAATFASGALDAVWSVATRVLTAATNLTTALATPTNITAGTITTVTNLTNAPTNGDFTSTMKASINTEADTALTDYDPPTRAELTSDTNSILSKLLKYVQLMLRKDSAVATDNSTEVTAINADGGSGGGAFANTTDALEALRDRGDAAWITATGFSTHSAADVWAVATRELTAFSSSFKTGYALSSAGVQAIWDALTSALSTANSIGKLLVDNINATISSRSSHAAADVWAVATRVLTAGTNIVLAKGTGVTGFNDLSAAQVNTEADTALSDVGLTTTITGRIDAAVSTRSTVTTAEVNAEVVDVIRTDVIPDSVATDGTRPTVAQALLMVTRFLMEKGVSGTTVTVKKEDGSTSSMTFTLDDGSAPTSITRSG